MRKIFYLLIIPMVVMAQNDLKNFNGWEFLEWGLDIPQAETALAKRNIDYKPAHPSEIFPATKFEYQGFETNLHYDIGLYDIQQTRCFASNEKEYADEFFDSLLEELIDIYGNPEARKRDEDTKKETISWSLKFTKINLVYWFGPYLSILLQFNPNK